MLKSVQAAYAFETNAVGEQTAPSALPHGRAKDSGQSTRPCPAALCQQPPAPRGPGPQRAARRAPRHTFHIASPPAPRAGRASASRPRLASSVSRRGISIDPRDMIAMTTARTPPAAEFLRAAGLHRAPAATRALPLTHRVTRTCSVGLAPPPRREEPIAAKCEPRGPPRARACVGGKARRSAARGAVTEATAASRAPLSERRDASPEQPAYRQRWSLSAATVVFLINAWDQNVYLCTDYNELGRPVE